MGTPAHHPTEQWRRKRPTYMETRMLNIKNEHKVKQVRLNAIQESKLKTHVTALKENRNTRERDVNKTTNDGQTEHQEIAENGIEHIDSTIKNSKDKHKERKETQTKTLGKRSNGAIGAKNLELEV